MTQDKDYPILPDYLSFEVDPNHIDKKESEYKILRDFFDDIENDFFYLYEKELDLNDFEVQVTDYDFQIDSGLYNIMSDFKEMCSKLVYYKVNVEKTEDNMSDRIMKMKNRLDTSE